MEAFGSTSTPTHLPSSLMAVAKVLFIADYFSDFWNIQVVGNYCYTYLSITLTTLSKKISLQWREGLDSCPLGAEKSHSFLCSQSTTIVFEIYK